MKKMQAIKKTELQKMRENYLQNEKARVVRNALTNNDINSISNVLEAYENNPNIFSIDIETMPVTNQMQSGRCWIFSALNVLREMMAKKYNIKQFEFSQNYVAFYDKFEKINYFLEASLQEIETPCNDQVMRFLLENAVSDGGQWDMFVSLVKKYGLAPKNAMPETYQSSHTMAMNQIINLRLRKFVADTKKLYAKGKTEEIKQEKEKCLQECYGLLCDCFGVPPTEFTFEYVDKKKVHHAKHNVKPIEFYEKYLKHDLDDYVGIIHGPTKDKPYHKMYTVRYLGNVVDGNPISFLNLPLDEFKDLILKQLKAGEIVWFGCDCVKEGNRKTGLWDDSQFDYETTFDMNLTMSKEDMLDTRHSAMNHAMVFTGVNLVKNKPTRWKIENSWGEDVANKGYYICSDTWFDKYVYEAVVHKKYLNKKLKEVIKQKPKMLDPWDPFGSLAD